MEIADGVHKVEGIRVGNAYVVEAVNGLLAVDTGTPGSATHIAGSLNRVCAPPYPQLLPLRTIPNSTGVSDRC